MIGPMQPTPCLTYCVLISQTCFYCRVHINTAPGWLAPSLSNKRISTQQAFDFSPDRVGVLYEDYKKEVIKPSPISLPRQPRWSPASCPTSLIRPRKQGRRSSWMTPEPSSTLSKQGWRHPRRSLRHTLEPTTPTHQNPTINKLQAGEAAPTHTAKKTMHNHDNVVPAPLPQHSIRLPMEEPKHC